MLSNLSSDISLKTVINNKKEKKYYLRHFTKSNVSDEYMLSSLLIYLFYKISRFYWYTQTHENVPT